MKYKILVLCINYILNYELARTNCWFTNLFFCCRNWIMYRLKDAVKKPRIWMDNLWRGLLCSTSLLCIQFFYLFITWRRIPRKTWEISCHSKCRYTAHSATWFCKASGTPRQQATQRETIKTEKVLLHVQISSDKNRPLLVSFPATTLLLF